MLKYWLLVFSFLTFQVLANSTSSAISIVIGHENTALQDIFKDFEKQTGYQVQTRVFDNSQLKIELLKQSASSEFPDVALVPGDFLGLSYLKPSEIDPTLLNKNTNERFKKSAMVNGKYLGIPVIAGNHLVMYYNKSMAPSPALNWQQLSIQQQSYAQGHNIIAWSYNEMYWLIPTITAMQTLPLIGQKIQLNTPEMQQALVFYWELAAKGIVDSECDYQCSLNQFEQHKTPYLISGFWSYDRLLDSLGAELGIAPMPSINDKPMRSYFSSHVLVFLNNSLYGDKSLALNALATFMQSKEVQKNLWQKMSALPVNHVVLREIEKTADSNIAIAINLLNQSEPMPNNGKMAVVWEAMSIGFKRYAAGVIDVQQATTLMQHLAEESSQPHPTNLN